VHDGAQQRLVALGISLRLAQRHLTDNDGEVHALLDQAVTQLSTAVSELRAIAAAREEQHQARAGYTHELADVQEQLAAKEALVDRYLTDYEGNKIDRETVARRIDKLSEQIRQLRHRSDELTFLTTLDDQDLGTSYLATIRDRIQEIINTGTPQEAQDDVRGPACRATHRRGHRHTCHQRPAQLGRHPRKPPGERPRHSRGSGSRTSTKSGPPGTRTPNLRIKSPQLCQLS
jgi:Histidine kinase